MRKERLELSRVSPQDPKSCASTDSATFAAPTGTKTRRIIAILSEISADTCLILRNNRAARLGTADAEKTKPDGWNLETLLGKLLTSAPTLAFHAARPLVNEQAILAPAGANRHTFFALGVLPGGLRQN